ncbi:excinuclease ABC subunit UvrC, partial [Candidatus Gracilibacteria bacterium]|nr:excinuclease ABC subunit UvrC [Candidatus Gracilibacteria bacterium]
MIRKILKNIPKHPGIYQYFDKNGKIIYIGKSVNLFSRVHSYFNGKSKLNFAKQKMVDQIADIKTIVVENETESLILETSLIKEYLPKYNILMKDGKNHIYIKITLGDFPKIIKTRVKNKTGEYFGPYISSQDLDNILAVSKKMYGYGVGEHNFFKSKNSYNLDKYLFDGNIKGASKEEIKKKYDEILQKIRSFLKGNYTEVIAELRNEMLVFAQNHEFERADVIKNQIESIETLNEKQIVREGILGDYDIVHYIEKFDKIFIGKLEIRNSKILGFYPYEIKNELGESIQALLENFVKNNYLNSILSDTESKKPILIISKKINLVEDIFSNIRIEYPKIGTKVDLLKMCYKNIYEFAYKKHLSSLSTKGFTKQNMKNLLHVLNYERINKQILFECNDISHLSGTHTVASRSVIENGKTANAKYRKFKIKNLEVGKIDDFNSMREIMERRLKEIEKLGTIPDLIIIDGGKGQLSSVVEIIDEYLKTADVSTDGYELISKLQLVGLAKREEELFTLHNGEFSKIVLEKDSLELRLVQKIRDEAHRFAITFNRDSRIKSMKKNILESLPGFGPVTRKKILKEFGSVDKLKEIDREKLEKVLNN